MLLATLRCITSKHAITTEYHGIFTPKHAKQKFAMSMVTNMTPLHTLWLILTLEFSSLKAIAPPRVINTVMPVPIATRMSRLFFSSSAISYANQASAPDTISESSALNQEILIRSTVEGLMLQLSVLQVFSQLVAKPACQAPKPVYLC